MGRLRRGLQGVRLCVSDQHEGLRSAIARVLACPWQRCTVHYADFRVMPRCEGEVLAGAVIALMRSA